VDLLGRALEQFTDFPAEIHCDREKAEQGNALLIGTKLACEITPL